MKQTPADSNISDDLCVSLVNCFGSSYEVNELPTDSDCALLNNEEESIDLFYRCGKWIAWQLRCH